MTKVRVGAVQAEPVWVDLAGSVAKTISIIKEARSKGINVLGFPEVWIPGYLWYGGVPLLSRLTHDMVELTLISQDDVDWQCD